MNKKEILQLIRARLENKGFTVEITDTEIIGRLAGSDVEERVKIKEIINQTEGPHS
jgi:hypothetical protein